MFVPPQLVYYPLGMFNPLELFSQILSRSRQLRFRSESDVPTAHISVPTFYNIFRHQILYETFSRIQNDPRNSFTFYTIWRYFRPCISFRPWFTNERKMLPRNQDTLNDSNYSRIRKLWNIFIRTFRTIWMHTRLNRCLSITVHKSLAKKSSGNNVAESNKAIKLCRICWQGMSLLQKKIFNSVTRILYYTV